ncbi:MAG: DGQHR domain-containing protein [Gallionella sp.]|nr:DGQHR domain-containing protein [Gallionella sp.]
MASFDDGLVSDEAARIVYVSRSKSVDEKTISAANEVALATKVQGEEQDGWGVAKKNKKSVRVSRPKPMDRQLEDDVWSLLYKLGFKEFNADRNFTIKVGKDSPARQIDIFAKDDETVFIVECTHSQEQKSKSIKALIDKINAIREEVIKGIHSHYGREKKLKVKWAIATRNVDWRKADKERAAEAKIAVITEQDINYYTKLTDYLKEAARFQFLARYLKGEGVPGLSLEIPATKGSMGKTTFYNFLISPHELLKIAYISHKATSINDLETYQRMVKPSRLKNIAAYIDNGGQFPTNIVINFKTKDSLRFNKSETFLNSTFGTLKLPGQYGSAWVIDGQHRLYGFAFSQRGKNHVIPVLAYVNLPADEEMRLFVDINCEQVKVSRSLTKEIFSNLNYGSDDPVERLEAQYSRISLRLDEIPSSPILNRVLTVSKDKDSNRCLTLTSLADGIKENRFLGSITQSPPNPPMVQPGPLSDLSGDLDITTEKAADVLAGYFDMFAKGVPSNWQLGDAKGGFLCTNNGLRALLRLLKELIAFIESREHVKFSDIDANEILEKVAPYIEPLVDYFANAAPSDIQNFRSRQALDGVKKNSFGMMSIISSAKPEFSNKELQEYLSTRDKDGTAEAAVLLREVNDILHKDIVKTLKDNFGEKWFMESVPKNIRSKCLEMYNEEGSAAKEYHQYLFLIDYQTIVLQHMSLFEKKYRLDADAKSSKTDKVNWIGKLNEIRKTTAHPEKGLISKDEVEFVRKVHALVKERIMSAPD